MTIPAGPGDPVGGVPDLSGNGYHGAQATQALKPTLMNAAFPSGRRGLYFDGVDDRLILSDLGSLFSGHDVPFTVALVFRLDDASYRALQGLGNSSTSTPYSMLYAANGSMAHYRRDDASVNATLNGPAVTTAQTHIVVATFAETPGVIARTVLNGTSEQSGTLDVGTTTVNRFVIGAVERSGIPLYPFKGRIGAWIVVGRVLTAPERTAVARYLMNWAGV